MDKTTYKFTAYVEIFHDGLNRNMRYYADVKNAEEAFCWISEMTQSPKDLLNFGFYEKKTEK